jgi:hypothetical protein
MNVHELRRLAESNKNKTIRLYNPDTEDFVTKFDDGLGIKEYTLKALEMSVFPYAVANHIKKHLAYHLLYKRGERVNPESDLKKLYEEIEVTIE